MNSLRTLIAGLAVLALNGAVMADSYSVTDKVVFQSSLEPSQTVSLPKFNDLGGTLTLTSVLVEFLHDGGVDLAGDNDDPFDHGQQLFVRGQMIRSWSATGPAGLNSGAFKVTNSPLVPLSPDDGDGGDNDVFDGTAPDGHDFGTILYSPLTVSHPGQPLAPYQGVGTVDFEISPDLMVNQLEFTPYTPDAWQLEVENPYMSVRVRVTYEFVPEPSTISLLGLGALALIRRRR